MKFVEYKEKQKLQNVDIPQSVLVDQKNSELYCLEVNISSGNLPPWKYFKQLRQGVQHSQCWGQIYDT